MLFKGCYIVFLAVVGLVLSSQETKQQPELSKIVRNWAEKLGGELWHFGELVTRRNSVIDSYKRTTVQKEDGEQLLNEIADKITKMMAQKVEAIRRIMEVAENKAVVAADEVEASYDFYNAKNLTNSEDEHPPESQALKQTLHFAPLAPDEHSSKMVQQDESEGEGESEGDRFQQDQDQDNSNSNNNNDNNGNNNNNSSEDPTREEEEEEDDESGTGGNNANNIEVTDGSEQDPMASQRPPDDKRRLPLTRNHRFYNNPVNTNYSAVHVPSNVYERSKEVIKGIKWSEELDETFRNNYKTDPTSSWQYFGSSTGFMRQFPAMIWSQEPIDLFDCRTRSWYIEAASSPKDVVILVDRSGSMTGMRREIAKHVVNNILDTLGNNDYVNIFTFSNTTDALEPCFDNLLVQANLANVRRLKSGMGSFKTEQIANFSLALTTAFRLLQDYRENRSGLGAQCNQAIMLVTDGVQDNFMEVFREYNWQNLPFMPVRVFTYLIGREVSDVRDVKWMACANQGYYVHLSTYAEVREQVLQYVPVMARPMVLNPTLKPNPTWSPVYADVTDPKLTNWLWVTRERNKQRDRFLLYRRNRTLIYNEEQDKKFVHQQKAKQDNFGEVQTYRLMTSVSLPVYDKRPNMTKIANLLGVAGTDVPIEYIQRLMLPYRLGVNGYAFIVTNNGYILTHPDLRPVFQGILKPAYNRVDIIEIEILDDDAEPRDFDEVMMEFRNKVIRQEKGKIQLRIKEHLDNMRRIILHNRTYYYRGIDKTPFSLVVTLPEKYGVFRVQHPVDEDIHRLRSKNLQLIAFFTGNWTIHPDWHYCRYFNNQSNFDTPEEELLHFLQKIDMPGWKWSGDTFSTCDRKLICKVVYDAKITEWFAQNITTKEENGNEFLKRFGITVAFLATHSGLTRWLDFPQNTGERNAQDEPHFHQLHNRATDEVWYKRAVLQHYVQPRSFVYSVPFYEDNENYTLVTASHAVFREEKDKKAPAAVVGFQFYHKALYGLFEKITNNCGDIKNCKRHCGSEELFCVVLDDNGYIIVADKREHTGFFFGDIRPDIMQQLVDEEIYKRTVMYDYQATCFQPTETANPASSFSYPLAHLAQMFQWTTATLMYFLKSTLASETMDSEYHDQSEGEEIPMDSPPMKSNEKDIDAKLLIRKTQPEPCDTRMYIHNLVHYSERNITKSGYNKTMSDNCSRPFIVQPVSSSNLILIVINNICPEQENVPEYLSPHSEEVLDYNMSLDCYRALFNEFPRRHYMSCINRSIHEQEIKLCGKGCSLLSSFLTVLGLLALPYVYLQLAL